MNIAVILAGGVGRRLSERLGLPKQFLELNGKPIIMHTVDVFDCHPDVDAVYLVCLADWEDYVREFLTKFGISKVREIIPGGPCRRLSILAALERLEAAHSRNDVVLVHDGVRPFLPPDLITRVVAETRKHGSVTAAYANYEALLVSPDGKDAIQRIPRQGVYDIQTPQGFLLGLGLDNHREAARLGIDANNDMSGGDLFIALGHRVKLVDGSKANMKLTTGDDMALWQAIDALQRYGAGHGGGKRFTDAKTVKKAMTTGGEARSGVHPVVVEDVEGIIADATLFGGLRGANILITGVSGMVGSYLALTLHEANQRHDLGLRLFGISRQGSRFHRSYPDVDIEILDQDVRHPLWTDVTFDHVIHAASPIGSRAFSMSPMEALSVNAQGTLNMLNRAVHDRARRFLLMSSVEIYGDAEGLIGEDVRGGLDSLNPRSCYPEGKRAAETACACAHRQFGLETVVVRLARTYGPMMNLDCGLFIADFMRDCRDGKPIALSGDGTVLRQILYASDAVRGILTALERGSPGNAYNVAPAGIASIGEIAAKLAGLCRGGKIDKAAPDDGILYGESGREARLAIGKIGALGWRPQIGLDEGLKRTLSFFGAPIV